MPPAHQSGTTVREHRTLISVKRKSGERLEGDKYGTSGQLAKWYVRMMPEKEECLRKHAMDRNIGYQPQIGSCSRTETIFLNLIGLY